MATLRIGRLSMTVTEVNAVDLQGGVLRLSGDIVGSSLAQTRALLDELDATLRNPDLPIAVTWSEDPLIDAFYLPAGGAARIVTLTGNGWGRWSANLIRLGTEVAVRFQSKLTGKTLTNDHSYTGPGVGYVGPPVDWRTFDPSAGVTTLARIGSDGTSRVRLNVDADAHPIWMVAPASYYKGACEIFLDGFLRAGRDAPNDPLDWQIGNNLVRVTPDVDGGLDVEHYDGAAWRSTVWQVRHDGADVGDWYAVRIIRNTPERCVIELVQPRVTFQGLLTVQLGVRRGSRIIDGVYTSDTSGLALSLRSGETGSVTAPIPTGAMIRDTVDGSGHRWMIGSELTATLTTGTGTLNNTAARLPFMISKEIDEGSGVQSGDQDSDLWDQYLEWRSEKVVVSA
jgi:hypothetical protein